MCSPRPPPTATSALTISPPASIAPTPANVDSSANSKPSDTRSPSNPPPRNRSPEQSPTTRRGCRVTDPCHQNVPGHHSYVSGWARKDTALADPESIDHAPVDVTG